MMESFVIETDHVVEPLNARLYNNQDLDKRYRKIFLKIHLNQRKNEVHLINDYITSCDPSQWPSLRHRW